MMKTQIPGWGELEIKNLILDFNGTIAKDGKVLEGVKELLGKIHEAGIEFMLSPLTPTALWRPSAKPCRFMSKSLAATPLPETNAACARNWAARTPPASATAETTSRYSRQACFRLRSSATRALSPNPQCWQTFWSTMFARHWNCCFSKPSDRHPARVDKFPQRAPEPGALFVFQEPGKGRGHRMVV